MPQGIGTFLMTCLSLKYGSAGIYYVSSRLVSQVQWTGQTVSFETAQLDKNRNVHFNICPTYCSALLVELSKYLSNLATLIKVGYDIQTSFCLQLKCSSLSSKHFFLYFLETHGMKYICNLLLLCSDVDTSVTN